MRYLSKFLFIPIFLLVFISASAQNKHTKLADDAFKDEQYFYALTKYQKAYSKIKKNREERDRISFQIAECYRLMNVTKRAEASYKRLINTKYIDKNPGILLYYANSLKSNGKYDEAIERYQEYNEKVPSDSLVDLSIDQCIQAKEWIENPSKYAVELEKKINSREDDFAPAYADRNYNAIIFTSNRDAATGKEPDNWTGLDFTDLFFARKDRKGDWNNPLLLDQGETVSTISNEGVGQFNERFTKLYFTRCWNEPGKKSGCAIYRAAKTGGSTWGEPEMIDLGGDSTIANGHPTLSSDESLLIFASNRPGGSGGKDLWIAKKKQKSSKYDHPVNLGEVINTPNDEMFPFLRNDTILYFASSGHPGMGGLDIFQSVLVDGKWSEPVNMKYPLNTFADDFALVFNPSEPEEGFFSSNRPKGKGKDDIYSFIIPPVYFSLEGDVIDDLTLQPVPGAHVSIIGTNGKTAEYHTDDKGHYSFNKNQILPNATYEILVVKEDYFNEKGTETTVGLESSKDLTRDFVLKPIPKKPVVLPDILYDLAKWDLKPQFQDSLQGLIQTLDANETIVIELASHTDSRDTEERNDILSQKRAQSVVDYLVSRGIDPDRLVAKGYGERVPRTLNRDIVRDDYMFKAGTILTDSIIDALPDIKTREDAHQLNRRTEFSILRNDYIPKQRPVRKEAPKIEVVTQPEENSISYTLTKDDIIEATGYVNGITMKFQFEPNEKEVLMSPSEALRLLKSGVIDKNDFEGDATKAIGEGSIANNSVFNIREMKIGKNSVYDIRVIVNQRLKTSMQFGTNTLSKFGNFSLDTAGSKIIFE